MTRRVDVVGLLLLAVALYASIHAYGSRSSLARWYAEAIRYNEAITRLLVQQREHLAGRPVAVYGIAGPSPWVRSEGDYLAQLLGERHVWKVFVPAPDVFYPLGTYGDRGAITVYPQEQACSLADDPRTVHIVIPASGQGRLVADCREGRALAAGQR
jgi:hypothetical protein